MTSLSDTGDRVAAASGLPELLDAAYEAFEAMLTVIRQNDNPSTGFFVPMVMAGASAGNGRDYLLFAPSLPVLPLHPGQHGENGQRSLAGQAAADWLAEMCRTLVGRLSEALTWADVAAGDGEACLGAARCAQEIRELMGGGRT
jgi:hypothetical protein